PRPPAAPPLLHHSTTPASTPRAPQPVTLECVLAPDGAGLRPRAPSSRCRWAAPPHGSALRGTDGPRRPPPEQALAPLPVIRWGEQVIRDARRAVPSCRWRGGHPDCRARSRRERLRVEARVAGASRGRRP